MAASLKPIPRSYLKISPKFRPQHPPVFDGDPTEQDVEEARALFLELDPESQAWYGRRGVFTDLCDQLGGGIASPQSAGRDRWPSLYVRNGVIPYEKIDH